MNSVVPLIDIRSTRFTMSPSIELQLEKIHHPAEHLQLRFSTQGAVDTTESATVSNMHRINEAVVAQTLRCPRR